jgi:Lamin Tail Domain
LHLRFESRYLFGAGLNRESAGRSTRKVFLLKRITTGIVCGLAALILSTTASAGIRITGISFDSPGSDTGSRSSLNAEWIRVKNTGSAGKFLTGWTIRDGANHVYKFGSFKLGAGKSVTVHTGSGSNTASNRYWRSGWYIWNNDGDRAKLKNRAGNVIDTCSYISAGSTVAC